MIMKLRMNFDIPATRRFGPFAVHVVAGNGHRREVGQEVVEQDLFGKQRQEGQEERGAGHAEHVAEVGAGGREDIFERIGKGRAALFDALPQYIQILLQQHKVGGFFGHIHGAIDRDAHIGGVQGRRVVDAVAHVADHMPRLLQGPDDALLLVGVHLGKEIVYVPPDARGLRRSVVRAAVRSTRLPPAA